MVNHNLHPPTHMRGADGEMVRAEDVLTAEEMRAAGYARFSRGPDRTPGAVATVDRTTPEWVAHDERFADQLAQIDRLYLTDCVAFGVLPVCEHCQLTHDPRACAEAGVDCDCCHRLFWRQADPQQARADFAAQLDTAGVPRG